MKSMPSDRWRKSTTSMNNDCIELDVSQARVLVRDSKNPTGPALSVPHADWSILSTCGRDA